MEKRVVVQSVGNPGYSFKAPVLVLGFSPREIVLVCAQRNMWKAFPDGYITCNSKSWSLPKCQQANRLYGTSVPQTTTKQLKRMSEIRSKYTAI